MHRETAKPGPLRNGHPRGNPDLTPRCAPRCGARTRVGCGCRAPAMANGRCRMHGGRSTGPRTPEGRARIRAAHTTHGGYGVGMRDHLDQMDALIADTRAMRATRGGDPGPPPRPDPAGYGARASITPALIASRNSR